MIGLGKFFIQQIKLTSSDSQKGVFLECLLAVLKTLKSEYVRKSSMFASYVRLVSHKDSESFCILCSINALA